MTGKVKYMGKAPSPTPKAVTYAQIDDQGRIPYGSTESVSIPAAVVDYKGDASKPVVKKTARGMGAAKRGGSYIGC
jgi:hypothetical protein